MNIPPSSLPPPAPLPPVQVPANKEWHHAACCKTLDTTLQKNEDIQVRMLVKAMAKAGCPIDEAFFQCKPCNKPVLGYYNPSVGVVVCQNFEAPEPMVTDTVIHELIHAFDLCRANLDPSNCVHQACTEIRAAHLSGDCRFSRELARRKPGLVNHMQECVFRRAEMSLSLNERCKDNAAQHVRKAWDVCYNDYEPWSKIPY